ncbi:MAG: hypothetical protein EPO24_16025 [Bacteroidetes bacterium]|nr:MAG: hypothetical protein EPO24_16025 [Bacteroidota bacterium]
MKLSIITHIRLAAHDLKRGLLSLFIILCLFFVPCYSQDEDSSSVSDVVTSLFRTEQPKIGLLAQMSGYIIDRGTTLEINGVGNKFRLFLTGSFARKFTYIIQGDFLEEYHLLDLKFSYIYREYLTIDFGRFKAPFGKEFLIKDENLLFIDRSRVASKVGPNRQDGIQLRGKFFDGHVTYRTGVFGGEGTLFKSQKISLYSGRITASMNTSDDVMLAVGYSTAYSEDPMDVFAAGFSSGYSGDTRRFWGTDARIEFGPYWVEGEYLTLSGGSYFLPEGAYIDVGKNFGSTFSVAARLDWFQEQVYFLSRPEELRIDRSYLIGLNWYPEPGLKFMLDFQHYPDSRVSVVTLLFSYAVNTGN